MSNVEQGENHATMQQLKEEIRRLEEQQSAAEKIAGLVGMTTDDAEQYRERHYRIQSLTSQLAVLDNTEEVALMSKKKRKRLRGKVEEVLKPIAPLAPEAS